VRRSSNFRKTNGNNTGCQKAIAAVVYSMVMRVNMKRINFVVTVEELTLLTSLASDQLFRRQFIDPKMPGYKGSSEDVARGKALVGRMQLMINNVGQHPELALP
jgi:hypothetical protein